MPTQLIHANTKQSRLQHTIGAAHDWCSTHSIVYDQSKQGNIIILRLANKSNMNKYYFLTSAAELIELDNIHYHNGAALRTCAAQRLDIDLSKAGHHREYGLNQFGGAMFELRNGTLEYVLSSKYPFVGELRINDQLKCTGEYKYADNIISWENSVELCIEQYKQDVENDDNPALITNRFYNHLAGHYYLCGLHERASNQYYFYRVDMEKEGKPGVVLMRVANRDEMARWNMGWRNKKENK